MNQQLDEPTIRYPILKYYKNINKYYNKIINIINNNDKIIIMLIGFPAYGKTYLRNYLIDECNELQYCNNDEKIKLTIQNKYIVDNTNLNNRHEILEKFNNHFKLGIFFNYDLLVVKHLNYLIMTKDNGNQINKITYNILSKKFIKPKEDEFDKLIILKKLDINLMSNFYYF